MTVIRDFTPQDRTGILNMVNTFYNSPGVLHKIPTRQFADVYDEMCNGGSGRLRGLAIEHEGELAGYCSLSFSYSTEAGGLVVLIEEVYISSGYRGRGLGGKVFAFLRQEYQNKAARLRLEVVEDNEGAINLYQRLGFQPLPYKQMILDLKE